MIRLILGIGLALIFSATAIADWQPAPQQANPLDGKVVQSVKIPDKRGNYLDIYKDDAGMVKAELSLNSFLPTPDQISLAIPVAFVIDGSKPHFIDAGKWETGGLYRKLVFTLGGAREAGLSEALIEILEGDQVTFRYSANTLGYESVRFPLRASAAMLAQTLAVGIPIDHEQQNRLRESYQSAELGNKAVLLNPVDPQMEHARTELIEHQLDLIKARIVERWIKPSRWQDMRCTVQVTLMSTGKVLQVAIVKTSGDPAFDASIESAVRDASPLPLPADNKLFGAFQQLELVFDPAAAPSLTTVSARF